MIGILNSSRRRSIYCSTSPLRKLSSAASGSSSSSRRGLASSARPIAARQRARPPLQKMPQTKQLDHLIEMHIAFRGRSQGMAIEQVAPYRQVREQPPFLEHIADAPLLDRDVD